MILKKFFLILLILTLPSKLFGDTNIDDNNHQFNLYLGNFDFSDDKQKATLLGFQHQNENLNRNTFLGNISPVTGGFLTENSAAYIYTGVEWNMDMGPFFSLQALLQVFIMKEMEKILDMFLNLSQNYSFLIKLQIQQILPYHIIMCLMLV